MIVIPTIDIRRGACEQTGRACLTEDRSPRSNPIALARSLAFLGFQRLHLVDADANAGTGSNATLIEDVIVDGAIDIQASGGVQSADQIERWVNAGAKGVIVGARATDEPRWLSWVTETFPGLIVVSTDVNERRLVTRGWVRNLPLDVFDVIAELEGLPVGGILLSKFGGDVHRTAGDLALLEEVAERCEFPLIASGGVSTLNDLRALEHRGVSATVVGSGILTGDLDARLVAQEFGGYSGFSG